MTPQPWLAYVRLPGGHWYAHRPAPAPAAYRSAADAFRSAAHLGFTRAPNTGTIATASDAATRLLLAPTRRNPPRPPTGPGRVCAPDCPLHPHLPLAHVLGHDALATRLCRTLHRSGYTDYADLTTAYAAGAIHSLPGTGPQTVDRIRQACEGTLHTPGALPPDTHRLATLIGRALTLVPPELHPAYADVHTALDTARQRLSAHTQENP